ncbi:hypothetical protein DESUT3_23840 [Desulfuromonas versatilis]|uniref:Helix-turn-helix domain-containing protein n=1 Tax=Desulfuromonas versatilis TaxID=2802975 RepID=A0ABM8HW20_9BACT|nr:helix-turn-helix domain-containing protein [Desulfuromonas versatilis]BCR05315.1 hypothetical protein DESUT3_23840 [Desulfuromonas versatilis]
MKIDIEILPDGRMDTANTAAYIGYKVHTLAQWRHEKKGPPYIKRGRVYYFKDDVDAWLKEGGKR